MTESPKPISIKAKGFSAFGSVQGKTPPAGPNKGVHQMDDGRWVGWRREPPFQTAPYPTRAQAKIALIKGTVK